MIVCDCGPLVCVMAAESFLMSVSGSEISPESDEKSLQRQWVMRERHEINGLNSPRLCDLTIALAKVKILLSYVIILIVHSTNLHCSKVYLWGPTVNLTTWNYYFKVIWLWAMLHWGFLLLLTLCFPVSTGVSYSYVQGQAGDEDAAVDVKLYSHRWRRWLPPKPRNMDSNRASQEQDREPEQVEPEGLPGLLSAEETDNSSQIEVGAV